MRHSSALHSTPACVCAHDGGKAWCADPHLPNLNQVFAVVDAAHGANLIVLTGNRTHHHGAMSCELHVRQQKRLLLRCRAGMNNGTRARTAVQSKAPSKCMQVHASGSIRRSSPNRQTVTAGRAEGALSAGGGPWETDSKGHSNARHHCSTTQERKERWGKSCLVVSADACHGGPI